MWKDIGYAIIATRAATFDQLTDHFLADHPDATVLHVGCGMDSRVFRVNPPASVQWFDVDYPDVIDLRRHLLPQRGAAYHLIGARLDDLHWLDEVPRDRPGLLVAEGVLHYLGEKEVKALLNAVAAHFPGGQIIFDICDTFIVKGACSNVGETGATYKWGLDDPQDIKQLEPKLELIREFKPSEQVAFSRFPLWHRRRQLPEQPQPLHAVGHGLDRGRRGRHFAAYPLPGVEVVDDTRYRVTIHGKYPQFAYWLAMPFFAPMPHEVVSFYAQPGMKERNLSLDWWPVGSGPYYLSENDPNRRMVLTKNPYYDSETYPAGGEPGDAEAGLLADAGKPLPLIDSIVFSLEKETIPYWNKFLQGYYDASAISSDSFDQAVQVGVSGEATVSEAMKAQGIAFQHRTLGEDGRRQANQSRAEGGADREA